MLDTAPKMVYKSKIHIEAGRTHARPLQSSIQFFKEVEKCSPTMVGWRRKFCDFL